jgi:hypothetical protein
MNTTEQSPRYNRENAMIDGTLTPVPLETAPAHPPTPVSERKHWDFGVWFFLMLFGAIAWLVYLLRGAPTYIFRQEFEGLCPVICALAYVRVFIRHVSHALAEDNERAELPYPVETPLTMKTLSEGNPRRTPSGNTIQGYKTVELRT